MINQDDSQLPEDEFRPEKDENIEEAPQDLSNTDESFDLNESESTFGGYFYDAPPDLTDGSLIKVTGMYREWFLDYASYVILERAVPAIEDGFKPVQRRIMHSMKELDDGRYNKVANIVGHTMQYHPHGDASIGDAMVQIGQRDLLIDTQGNWGNILTGDGAAASRYIEARISKFGHDVLYSPKITTWQASYDGRRNEPVTLPVKFPLLLAQGVEGIAVGLSTKVLPHNFNELIDASIKVLKNKPFVLFPDFPTGGIADITNYNDGLRGGKVRVRAKINQVDKQTLSITQIPFSTNTSSLIDSILKANEKGKIKIKKIDDNTAAEVEIMIHLPPGVSPDKTIDALYAFTVCETSISPLGCVIENHKPRFLGVSDMLRISTNRTVDLLKNELIIQLKELEEQRHFLSLERIFIENKIYRLIEEETTREGVIQAVDDGLKPFVQNLKRAVTEDDILRLLDIRIMRISKYDSNKAQDKIDALEANIEQVKQDIEHIIDFAIDYFTKLKEKYGKGRERQTELRSFENIEATKVVMKNAKLYVNRIEGFIGSGLKRDEFVCDCSDIDDVIVFLRDGKMMVTKIDEKKFIGKDIIHIAIFDKNDKRTIYNMIYRDGKNGTSYIKRFNVSGITRDKFYDLTQENPGSQVLYFTANPNGEAETIVILLRQLSSVKKLKWDINFADIAIKGRATKGNIVTKYAIRKIELKEKGISTLRPRKVWFDNTVQRLNVEARGELLGEFKPDDRLLIINQAGKLKTIVPDLSLHFDDDMIVLEKWIPQKPISCIYFDGEKQKYYIKRFVVENPNKEEIFISEHEKSFLELVSTDWRPVAEVVYAKVRGVQKDNQIIDLEQFIAIKGIKALGNQLTGDKIKEINALEPLHFEPPIEDVEEIFDESVENKDLPDMVYPLDENGQPKLF